VRHSAKLGSLALVVPVLVGCGGRVDSTDEGAAASTVDSVSERSAGTTAPVTDPWWGDRPGAWAPPFQSEMILWLRADKGVTLASDGSVAVWADQTGLGGRDAAPLFPGMLGPLYVADAYGDRPALRGDGTRSLIVHHGHGYPVGEESSFFMVASAAPAGSSGTTFDDESTQGWQYAIEQTSAGVRWFNASSSALDGGLTDSFTGNGQADTFLFTAAPTPGLHVYAEAQRDGLHAAGYYDGRAIASLLHPVGPSLYVTSLFGGPGDAFDANDGGFDPQGVIVSSGSFDTNADIQEVIQYGRELSPAEVALVVAYLRARWPGCVHQGHP
jgi:hypothetical protein